MSVCSLNYLLTGLISPIRLPLSSQQSLKLLSVEYVTLAWAKYDSLDIVLQNVLFAMPSDTQITALRIVPGGWYNRNIDLATYRLALISNGSLKEVSDVAVWLN